VVFWAMAGATTAAMAKPIALRVNPLKRREFIEGSPKGKTDADGS
jgi:hypothetical protein